MGPVKSRRSGTIAAHRAIGHKADAPLAITAPMPCHRPREPGPRPQQGNSMRRMRNVKIVATLGPASDDYEIDPRAARGRRRRVPPEHEPRQPRGDRRAPRDHPPDRSGSGPPDRHPRRPAGPEAARRRLRERRARSWRRARRSASTSDDAEGDATRVQLPHPEIFAGARAGRRASGQRRQDPPEGRRVRRRFRRLHRDRRRHDLEPQGRERARRGAAAGGAVGQGPQGSGIRLRAGRRLAGALLRAAPRGRDRGARARARAAPRSCRRSRSPPR